jgi:hypothetical protein
LFEILISTISFQERRSPIAPGLEALPYFGHINLFKVLRVLIAQLEVAILNRFFDSLFAAQPDDGADALLDAPASRNAGHANFILLRDLLHALNNLLVDGVFPLVDKRIEELVALGAA